MHSYSKLDTQLHGDTENKVRQRERKRVSERVREYHGESEIEAFTNRENIIRSVMGAEGDFPVTDRKCWNCPTPHAV